VAVLTVPASRPVVMAFKQWRAEVFVEQQESE